MKFNRKWILCVIFIFSTVFFCGCSANDPGEELKQAEEFYKAGKIEDARYHLSFYLQEFPSDVEANILMAEWYDTDADRSLMYYRKAAEQKEYEENSLNYLHVSEILSGSIESFIIKPAAKYTRSMTVTFSSSCFSIDENSEKGKINVNEMELISSNCKTSQWFPVNSAAGEISVYGKINCAFYQFMDKNGNIRYFADDSIINSYSTIRFSNKAYSAMEIPKDAVKARITYYDPEIEDTVDLDEGVFVQYGSFVQGYTKNEVQVFEIPDLEGDEYVEYKNGKWTLYADSQKTDLKFEKISENLCFVSISGELIGELDYTVTEKKEMLPDKEKEFGISFLQGSTDFSCKRIYDAENMNFNFKVNDTWKNYGNNDFDQAYPWCGMKRCNLCIKDGKTKIIYEGEEGYSEDGSNGNVMVEIPKFYTKREVTDGYETIAVSGVQHDGYQLDPAFIGKDGSELEYIYVGAYLGSKQEGEKMQSISGAFPEVKMYLNDAVISAENNGSGYGEIDYVTYAALQKLFIIETGNINSSSIFCGDTANLYFFEDESKSCYALYDEKDSNRIVVDANTHTLKLAAGDSITIFTGWDEYENTAEYHREIENISRDSEKNLCIIFSGEPMDIKAGETAISNIPIKTGKTDVIDYCTGIDDRGDGKSSFKYRGIENLYGSVMTILDQAELKKDRFSYKTADGKVYSLNFYPTVQNSAFSDADNLNRNFIIKSMGYDPENPLVMLPVELGDGASGVSSYGDFWMLYSKTNLNSSRYLTVGGTNDNYSLAGLFHMRAHFASDSNNNVNSGYVGSRIMYRSR